MGSLASAGTTPAGKTRVRVLPALRPRAPPRPAVHEASSTGFDAPAALGLATTRRPGVAFVGEGARRFGGRWNPVGVPVVYAATTLSLAALEVLAHVDPEEARRYWVYRIVVPDDAAERLVPADAPRGWNAARPRPATARVGAKWAASLRLLALLVPSVHVPSGEEMNVLLNPRHPRFVALEIAEPAPYAFDPRLFVNRWPHTVETSARNPPILPAARRNQAERPPPRRFHGTGGLMRTSGDRRGVDGCRISTGPLFLSRRGSDYQLMS